MVSGMKHIKIHVDNAEPKDEKGFKFYPGEVSCEIDGEDVTEQLCSMRVSLPRDGVAFVEMGIIPDKLDIELREPKIGEPSPQLIEGQVLEARPSLDDFAIAAMQAYMQGEDYFTPDAMERLAQASYDAAEAMLSESNRRRGIPVEESEPA